MQLRRVSAASDASLSVEDAAHRHREVRISQVDRESLADLRQLVPSAPALQRPTAALRPLSQEGQRLLEELPTSVQPGRRRTCASPSTRIDSPVIPTALSERSASEAAAGARQRLVKRLKSRRPPRAMFDLLLRALAARAAQPRRHHQDHLRARRQLAHLPKTRDLAGVLSVEPGGLVFAARVCEQTRPPGLIQAGRKG